MGALAGWFAVGYLAKDGGWLECGGYPRPVFRCNGSPPVGAVPRIIGHPLATPVHGVITHGAVLDAETGGHCLVSFKLLPPHAAVPDPVAPFEFSISFGTRTLYALNADTQGLGDPELVIAKDARIAWINGQPAMTGCRLTIRDGQFVPYALVAQRKKATA